MELTGRTVLSSRLGPGIEIGALQKGFYQQNGLNDESVRYIEKFLSNLSSISVSLTARVEG